jgi:hypothetical protein
MRKRIGLMVGAVACVVSLLGAASAAAATEVGSDCAAANGSPGATFVQLTKAPGSPLPIEAPAGVVTKWKVNSAVGTPVSQQLVILRPTGKPNEFLTVAESASVTIANGSNAFETRISVQAGDRMGAAPGSPGGPVPAGLYCATANPADSMGALTGDPAIGSINTFPPNAGYQAAISAIVEPDADGDGFGDETQDKCPRSAALQLISCPLVTLGGVGKPKKDSAQILISASSQAPVTVVGSVKIPKKGKKGKARQVTIQGGTQSVSPGAVIPFNLAYPPALKRALTALPPSKSLPLLVTMTATDLAGQTSASQLTLKLKGQKKDKAKAKGKGKKG